MLSALCTAGRQPASHIMPTARVGTWTRRRMCMGFCWQVDQNKPFFFLIFFFSECAQNQQLRVNFVLKQFGFKESMGSGYQLDITGMVIWFELKSLRTWTSILTQDLVCPLGQWDFIHQGQESHSSMVDVSRTYCSFFWLKAMTLLSLELGWWWDEHRVKSFSFLLLCFSFWEERKGVSFYRLKLSPPFFRKPLTCWGL